MPACPAPPHSLRGRSARYPTVCPPTLTYRFAESQARVGTGRPLGRWGWSLGVAWNADGETEKRGNSDRPAPSRVRDLSSEHPLILVLFAASLLRPPSPLFSRAERQQLHVRPGLPSPGQTERPGRLTAQLAIAPASCLARHCINGASRSTTRPRWELVRASRKTPREVR